MKKRQKFLSVLLTAALTVTLTACGSAGTESTANTATSETTTDSEKVYKIGICQLLEHPALDAATEGFKEALTDKLGEDHVQFDLQNAQGETVNCSTIASGFVSDNVDLIMANATGALQASAAATSEIPIVATSVTDYATALDIDDWKGSTGTNVTGTSDLAPLDKQAEMIQELVPDVKQVGILYCSAEPNSHYQAEAIGKYLDEAGIKHKDYTAADSNEVQSAVTSAIADCNCLYVPTDNTMASNTEIIRNVAVPAGVPMIAGEEGICQGGLATLSISYHDIGYSAGEMAYEILVNGKDPGSMDIQFAKETTKEYNADVAKELGIQIPDDYKKLETE
ncbi:MAG: ABC transporter substrate-binding protein [Lachnospiraceae bacterium]